MSASAFLTLLRDGDVDALRGAWAKVAPHLPQPQTREQAEIVMHMTRTARPQLSLKHRAISHRWLTERNLPSQLPDELKPKAERMYPVVVAAVGHTWRPKSDILRPAKPLVDAAVATRIEELAAEGQINNDELMSREMHAAKEREVHRLFGGISKLRGE